MKESPNHLPQRKEGELARIVSIIRSSAPQAEMIILFGSYARGDWVQDVTTAANHDPAFFTVFPLRTKQERDRFDLLRQAYVGARYHDDYKITPQELKYLARCVELLRNQTETSCNKKMASFI